MSLPGLWTRWVLSSLSPFRVFGPVGFSPPVGSFVQFWIKKALSAHVLLVVGAKMIPFCQKILDLRLFRSPRLDLNDSGWKNGQKMTRNPNPESNMAAPRVK